MGELVGLNFYVVFFLMWRNRSSGLEICVGLAQKVGTDALLIPPVFRVEVFSLSLCFKSASMVTGVVRLLATPRRGLLFFSVWLPELGPSSEGP